MNRIHCELNWKIAFGIEWMFGVVTIQFLCFDLELDFTRENRMAKMRQAAYTSKDAILEYVQDSFMEVEE